MGQYRGGDREDPRIVARRFQCPVSVTNALQSVRLTVLAPPIDEQAVTAQCRPRQRGPSRVTVDRLLRKTQCLGDLPRRRPIRRVGSQIEIVSGEVGSLTARRTGGFGSLQLRLDDAAKTLVRKTHRDLNAKCPSDGAEGPIAEGPRWEEVSVTREEPSMDRPDRY